MACILCLPLQGCLLEQTRLQNERAYSLQGVERVSLSYTGENITILEGEGDGIILKEYLDNDDPAEFAQVTEGESTLIVQAGTRADGNTSGDYVEIYLPSSWSGELSITTTTGSISIKPQLTVDSLALQTETGQITTADITCPSVSMRTVSGRIDVPSLTGDVYARSSTSSVYVDDIDGSGTFESKSGNISVSFMAIHGDVVATNETGRIAVDIPEDCRVALLARTQEGSIRTPFEDDEILFENDTRLRAEHGSSAGRHAMNLATATGPILVDWT